ncbi:DUF2157 domain-containing protein [Paenibacillus sp. sptzw28]|uniref:DUF2157 domain-containing protein n=1 Tax=Paenibacillus sp. sptzw28 TaxID=715179 RepID=UPI001C6E2CC9|nr:DUF2157 domain-containing protein [Paenibacillus sp. sptzw28]QYR20440.1 DUF2157 domain-containing protein [Paenibacillus sp. sptzw28]
MSRKWLEHEGRTWIEKGIITSDQHRRLIQLYPEQKRAVGIIPILGSILVGLGILSFTAANWQDIPELVRLIMIGLVLVLFYAAGGVYYRKGQERLGIALLSIGLITFGAGIVLVAQMFHLVAYDTTSFIVWGCAGLLLTYLYPSRFLFLLSLLIMTWSQWYSVVEFNNFSYFTFAVTVLGFGYYWRNRQNALLAWCLALSFTAQSLMMVTVNDWPFTWFFLPVWLLYSLMDWNKERRSVYPFQAVPLVAAYLFNLFIVLFWDEGHVESSSFYEDIAAQPLIYGLSLLILLGISLAGKQRYKRLESAPDWMLALPFFYLTSGMDVVYLIILSLFSLYLLWRGYAEEWRLKINLGTLLFLCSTMAAYFKLTWGFMDKSVFFILGGIMLLALSWFLNRRKQKFLADIEEENSHELQ